MSQQINEVWETRSGRLALVIEGNRFVYFDDISRTINVSDNCNGLHTKLNMTATGFYETLMVASQYNWPNDFIEPIFSKGHPYHDRIFYDKVEGKYYDRATDIYLSLEEAKVFGVPV